MTPATAANVPVAVGVPAAPPLPDDLEALLRRLRLPHIRRHAPQVIATAKAQRWEPAEVLRTLLGEEAAGRERSALATRRAAAAFPTGKTFEAWKPAASSIPAPTPQALRTLEWIGRRENLVAADHPGPARRSCSKRSASKPSKPDSKSPGSPWKTSACSCAGTRPITPSAKPSPGSCEQSSWSLMT